MKVLEFLFRMFMFCALGLIALLATFYALAGIYLQQYDALALGTLFAVPVSAVLYLLVKSEASNG